MSGPEFPNQEDEFPNFLTGSIDNDSYDRDLTDDPDSEENALLNFETADPTAETIEELEAEKGEDIKSPELIEQIAFNIKEALNGYGWTDLEALSGEPLLELCERLKVKPESLEALIAIEDIGFSIENENYKARSLTKVPSYEDIEESAIKMEDTSCFRDAQTREAYFYLGKYIEDPILKVPDLYARRAALYDELTEVKFRKISTFEEYEEKERSQKQLELESRQIEELIISLSLNEEVTLRRERAFRRMHWLVKQDIFRDQINNFLSECRKAGSKPDFDTFAGFIAGRYIPDQVIVTSLPGVKIDIAKPEADRVEVIDADTDIINRRIDGIVDAYLQKHIDEMLNQSTKTANDRENDALMLRRLTQARALCINVFQNDITDGIYTESPLDKGQQDLLDFVKNQIYMEGDPSILDDFMSFLPGSNLRNVEIEELETPLSKKFSGRSLKELFQEIDTIIAEHPTLDGAEVQKLVELWQKDELKDNQYVTLAVQALTVVEKLAYKEKHSLKHLLSDE